MQVIWSMRELSIPVVDHKLKVIGWLKWLLAPPRNRLAFLCGLNYFRRNGSLSWFGAVLRLWLRCEGRLLGSPNLILALFWMWLDGRLDRESWGLLLFPDQLLLGQSRSNGLSWEPGDFFVRIIAADVWFVSHGILYLTVCEPIEFPYKTQMKGVFW
jgi:hypothetical protein